MVGISVIIPAYNAIEYLDEALNSIINQSFKDLEIICVNDGSTDNTLERLNEYAKMDKRVQVYSQENKGPGGAINTGLSKATGKYLYFLDTDDILDLNALEEFYNIMEEKDLDLLIFKSITYDEDTNTSFEEDYYTMPELQEFVGDSVFGWRDIGNLIFKINVTLWSKFYRHDLIKRSQVQSPLKLIYYDEVFFREILFNSDRIYFYNKILHKRRVHSKSCVHSNDQRNIQIIKTYNLVIKTFIKYNQFEKYKDELYNRKINSIFTRYTEVNNEFKELFFTEMKKDYTKIIGYEKYDEFYTSLNPKNKYLFDNTISSNSHVEFDLKNEISALEINNRKLTNENNNLIKEANTLKKQNKRLSILNKKLLSSKSWKLTKPLRKIKNLTK